MKNLLLGLLLLGSFSTFSSEFRTDKSLCDNASIFESLSHEWEKYNIQPEPGIVINTAPVELQSAYHELLKYCEDKRLSTDDGQDRGYSDGEDIGYE